MQDTKHIHLNQHISWMFSQSVSSTPTRTSSSKFPFSSSAAASGVCGLHLAGFICFDRVIFSHSRLILRLINQDLGWRRTLASADHSFGPHRPAPSVVSAGTNGALRVVSETEEREHQINCTAEIRTPAEPLCLSIIHSISPSCLLCLRFIDTTFQC